VAIFVVMGARVPAIRRWPARAAVALAALVCGAPVAVGATPRPAAAAADRSPVSSSRDRASTERGIVQSVTASGLVLKTLDGSTVSVAVDRRTHVLVDGRAASILAIRPGFVVVVSLRGASGQAALQIEAFSSTGPG
jgi:hypothetical protein